MLELGLKIACPKFIFIHGREWEYFFKFNGISYKRINYIIPRWHDAGNDNVLEQPIKRDPITGLYKGEIKGFSFYWLSVALSRANFKDEIFKQLGAIIKNDITI